MIDHRDSPGRSGCAFSSRNGTGRRLLSGVAVAVLAFACVPAFALGPVTLKTLDEWMARGRPGELAVTAYVAGVRDALVSGSGVQTASETTAEATGQGGGLCMRDATDRQAFNAVRAALGRRSLLRQTPAVELVAEVLRTTWPCPPASEGKR